MALTLTTADSALKEFYLPTVREQLNNTNWLLSQIEKNSTDVEGRRAVLSLHVSRNSSIGARSSGGLLPGSNSGIGNQGYAEERVGMKRNYGRIQLEGDAIAAMKSDRGSFIRAVQSETQGVTEDLKRDVNRQLWGDGSGQIVQLGTTAGSTTVTVNSAATAVQLRQLSVGMRIDIGTATDVDAVASDRRITSVSFATPSSATFVISGAAVTTTSSHFVYRAGLVASGGNPSGVELTGLAAIIDSTGSLFNVDPSSFPVWASTEMAGSGGTNRDISDSLLGQLMHRTQIASGLMPGNDYVMACSDGVFRAYADTMTAQKRYQGEFNLKGGFSGLAVQAGGAPVALVWEQDAPAETLFYINTSHLKQHEMSDWDWMDKDGAVLSRVPNQDAYEATLYKYHELTTDRRNAHGKLLDITEA